MTELRYDEYLDELREQLEFRDVPVAAVVEIVREVESHTAESGEDPTIAFGPPSEYANNFAPRWRMARFWALIVSSVILASGGAYVLISGLFGLQSSTVTLWGLPPWSRITLGAVGIAGFFVLVLVSGARSKRRSSSWRVPADKIFPS